MYAGSNAVVEVRGDGGDGGDGDDEKEEGDDRVEQKQKGWVMVERGDDDGDVKEEGSRLCCCGWTSSKAEDELDVDGAGRSSYPPRALDQP